MNLNFNALVPRKLAEAIRLTGTNGAIKPPFDGEGDAADVVGSITFKPLFLESTPYVLELPKDFREGLNNLLEIGVASR